MSRYELILAGTLLGLFGPSCKRKNETIAPEIWDRVTAGATDQDLEGMAPSWPAATQATLSNQLRVHWLHEEGAAITRAALLIPESDVLPNVTQLAVVTHLVSSLRTKLRRANASVELVGAASRFEIKVSISQTERLLQALAEILSAAPPPNLSRQLTAASKKLGRTTSDEQGLFALLRALGLAHVLEHDVKVKSKTLEKAWSTLLDPSQLVLSVHAPVDAKQQSESLRAMAETWTSKVEKNPSTHARLQRSPKPLQNEQHLSNPRNSLIVVPTTHPKGSLWIGRTIPMPDAKTRAIARLAQRILQEEIDARITIVGNFATLVVRGDLPQASAESAISGLVTHLSSLATTRHQQQRLQTAAKLWLGARLVAVSLEGEDWTQLWSESLDLSVKDEDIASAIAVDAKHMLSITAEELQSFTAKWMDPKAGHPGWRWVAVASRDTVPQLKRSASVCTEDCEELFP